MAYNVDPNGRSAVLGPVNYDTILDQGAGIGPLARLLDRYPGEVRSVADDPRMMEAMHRSMAGMKH